jgi:hypothetical protein
VRLEALRFESGAGVNKRQVLGELRQIRRCCDGLIERIETEPSVDSTDLIDQHKSKLTARRHCAAVRRRRAEGKSDAFISGRQYLLTPEAYREELNREPLSRPGLADCLPDNDADEESAYRELRTRMGR